MNKHMLCDTVQITFNFVNRTENCTTFQTKFTESFKISVNVFG